MNLNLIPVLRELIVQGSVLGAAASLGRSPSAVSAALSQLRAALEDPLFIRVGAGLRPTSKAAELAPEVEDLCARLDEFFNKDAFEPAHSNRSFVIASSDLLMFRLGRGLVQAVRRHAPAISIKFVDIGRGLPQAMAAREIDFALLPDFALADLEPAPLRFQALERREQQFVLMSRDHPLASRSSLREADLADQKCVRFVPDQVLLGGRKEFLVQVVQTPEAAITVGQYLTVPYLLEGTDLIAIVPTAMAALATATLPLAAVQFAPPTEGWLGIAWSPVFDREPAHLWLRAAVSAQFAAPKPPAAESAIRASPKDDLR